MESQHTPEAVSVAIGRLYSFLSEQIRQLGNGLPLEGRAMLDEALRGRFTC